MSRRKFNLDVKHCTCYKTKCLTEAIHSGELPAFTGDKAFNCSTPFLSLALIYALWHRLTWFNLHSQQVATDIITLVYDWFGRKELLDSNFLGCSCWKLIQPVDRFYECCILLAATVSSVKVWLKWRHTCKGSNCGGCCIAPSQLTLECICLNLALVNPTFLFCYKCCLSASWT